MNAVEIEQAISDLALQASDRDEFPYAFLQAFGNKDTTIKRLRSGATNKSDLGGVLQTNNIHLRAFALGWPDLPFVQQVLHKLPWEHIRGRSPMLRQRQKAVIALSTLTGRILGSVIV